MFRLDKKKIFLLYQHYLLGNSWIKEKKENNLLIIWFEKCLKEEEHLKNIIGKKLKNEWEFSRLPVLERAILIFATYEMFFEIDIKKYGKMVIDQTINFCKVYCDEEEKYRYINKILDLLMKENIDYIERKETEK